MSAKKRFVSGLSRLIVGVSIFCGASSALAQGAGKRMFATRESCEISGVLSPAECRNAHDNALAELDEKAPRFPSRPECQKEFSQCMIAGFGGRRVEFQPAMRGFEVTLRSLGEKTVLPVLHVDSAAMGFRARSVSRLDASVSHAAREEAQAKRRQAEQARATAQAAAVKAAVPQGEIEPEISAPVSTVQTPRPPSQYDVESAARRRKEIESAPVVR